ncbi:MAG: hypothetical protein AAF596_04440, partial [Planctomycetota bacterium]
MRALPINLPAQALRSPFTVNRQPVRADAPDGDEPRERHRVIYRYDEDLAQPKQDTDTTRLWV